MAIALVNSMPFNNNQRSAAEDARYLLLKGFINNLSWSAAVHSVASTLLACDYQRLISPDLYFTQQHNLREAINQTGYLNWSQWVEWVEAAMLVKNYQTSHPSTAKQVLDAVSFLTSCNQNLSKNTLEKTYIQLQNTSDQNCQVVLNSRLKLNRIASNSTAPTAHNDPSETADLKKQVKDLKNSLRQFKGAFITLDQRAKSKLAAREALSKKLLRYLSLVSLSRKHLRIENFHLVIALCLASCIVVLQFIL